MNEGLQSRVEEAILEVVDVDFFTGFGEGDDLQIARVGEVAARFQQGELCAKIDFHIHERLRHAVEVRNLPREVIWTRSLIVATLKRFAP